MKMKIDSDGTLWIVRGKKLVQQGCPFHALNVNPAPGVWTHIQRTPCGNWCPLFGEPEEVRDNRNGALLKKTMLICQGRRLEGEITDERGEG